MDEQINGKPEEKTLPKIEVVWDPEAQAVRLEFDTKHFKKWGFIKHILGMAMDQAQVMNDMAIAQGIQEKAQQQAIQNQILTNLRR